MDNSVKKWACRIPFVAALVAAAAMGLTANALAASIAPDPAPGAGLTPRPDAAGGISTHRSGTQSTRRSSKRSQVSRTQSNTVPRTRQTTTKSAQPEGTVTQPKPAVRTGLRPTIALPTKAVASTKPSGRNETLLLGAALALGALTLASLGLVGLARQLRREVAA